MRSRTINKGNVRSLFFFFFSVVATEITYANFPMLFQQSYTYTLCSMTIAHFSGEILKVLSPYNGVACTQYCLQLKCVCIRHLNGNSMCIVIRCGSTFIHRQANFSRLSILYIYTGLYSSRKFNTIEFKRNFGSLICANMHRIL